MDSLANLMQRVVDGDINPSPEIIAKSIDFFYEDMRSACSRCSIKSVILMMKKIAYITLLDTVPRAMG